MPNSPLVEVRAHLQRYLLGVDGLADFHRWFVRWRRRHSEQLDAFAHDIDLRLAEYSGGDWTEPQLRGELLRLLQEPTMAPWANVSTTPWHGAGASFATLFEISAPTEAPATHSG